MDRLSEVWNRLASVFRRGRIDRELEEEIELHIELRTRENVRAGMSEEQARWAARRAFGNPVLTKEDSRGAWRFLLLETTLQDVRYGVRALLRSPMFTVAVVATLALGIGANTAIFTLLDRIVLRSLPVDRPEQLHVLGSRDSMTTIVSDGDLQRDSSFFSHPFYRGFREHTRVFSDLAAFSSWPVQAQMTPDSMTRGVHADRAMAWLVSGSFFHTLGVRAALGRTLTPEDDRTPGAHPVAVLSHSFWARRFGGDPDVVGRRIRLNRSEYTVVGVASRGFRGVVVGLDTDVWVPLSMQADLTRDSSYLADPNIMWLRLVGRLPPGLDIAQATARSNDVFRRLVTEEAGSNVSPGTQTTIAKLTTELVPFARGFSGLRSRYSQALVLLMTVVGLVLLIACANVSNLLLARASSRRREMAVRLALGAGRLRLTRQLLTESLLLALAGGALALGVARWTAAFILGLIDTGEVGLDAGLDGRVLAFTLGVSVLAALLVGLAPAFGATRVDLNSALKTQNVIPGETRRGWSLRRTLVVSQVAVSLVLLVGADLFLRSLGNLRRQDLGFRPQGLLHLELDPQGGGYQREQLLGLYEDLLQRVRALPAVESASLSFYNLLSGSGMTLDAAVVEAYTPGSNEDSSFRGSIVTPGYFETIGATLSLGRTFDARDREGSPKVAIVNQAFARHYFGAGSPIGKRFGIDGATPTPDIEIVGLVRDFKQDGLWEPPARLVYFPVAQRLQPLHSLEVRSRGDLAAATSAARAAVSEVAPDLPILGAWTLAEEIDRSLRQEKLLSRLTGFFGLIALVLASIGLYGVLDYGVAQRTGEIGIRLALGAPRRRVLWMVLQTAMGWVSFGVVLGLAVALASGRLVSSLLFGLAPADPKAILLATGTLVVVAACAGYWPARRASRLDPIRALRYE